MILISNHCISMNRVISGLQQPLLTDTSLKLWTLNWHGVGPCRTSVIYFISLPLVYYLSIFFHRVDIFISGHLLITVSSKLKGSSWINKGFCLSIPPRQTPLRWPVGAAPERVRLRGSWLNSFFPLQCWSDGSVAFYPFLFKPSTMISENQQQNGTHLDGQLPRSGEAHFLRNVTFGEIE